MAERRIIVEPSARPSGRDLAVRINGPDPTFKIATDRLSTRLVAPVPDRLLDLVEIASAVFAADSNTQRGGKTRPHFGSGWRRQFAFQIATREPAFLRRAEMQAALVRVVDALSEDEARSRSIRRPVPQRRRSTSRSTRRLTRRSNVTM